MANIILFTSSLLLTTVHLYIIKTNWLINIILLQGCISSLLNHGLTSPYIKLYDRMVMITSAGIELYICYSFGLLHIAGSILAAIAFFGIAKQYNYIPAHVIAHILVTVAHILLVDEFGIK